ncbi:3-phosphoshikimate 1-carboxyvinyltransferase [soil metagenome]
MTDSDAARLTAVPGRPLRGTVRAPGDKSISHRALILGALSQGVTTITGLLEGDDVLATAQAVRAFGAAVDRTGPGAWRVEGRGGLSTPDGDIDCGNSGTGVRLLMGAAAGCDLTATFSGDASLSRRPMGRVTEPLSMMGARFDGADGGRLPLTLRGGGLQGVAYTPPVASVQVKSAILLAGLQASGSTTVTEPAPTRDHTERMLRAFGAQVSVTETPQGRAVTVTGGARLQAQAVVVPGDPSSAAFPLVAALVTPGSRVTVEGVLLNPLRTGLFDTLIEMGADLAVTNRRDEGGEPVGDLTATYGPLHGVTVPPERAPSMIDEYPILAVAAAFAEGETVMLGLAELRHKESDRIALTLALLAACGVEASAGPDSLNVTGTGAAPAGGALVHTHGDHRITMSALTLGLASTRPVTVDEPGMIATSFPGYGELMARLGAQIG